MKDITLVDLDNIYFIDSKPRLDVLKTRIHKIKSSLKDPTFFGNTWTENFMKEHEIDLKSSFKSSKIGKDTADHDLIHFIAKLPKKTKIAIVTNDKTLQRFIYFKFSDKYDLTFYHFSPDDNADGKLKKNKSVGLSFDSPRDLKKFLDSYILYQKRFS